MNSTTSTTSTPPMTALAIKLLIAEDAPKIAEVVAFGARLTWPECKVILATTGEEALQRFKEEQPDLVVLDVEMPPPDGFEVCRRIRETSKVPILMLTVHDDTVDKVRAFDLGADDYLTKPFDHLELLARLKALVRRSAESYVPSRDDFAVGDLSITYATHEVRIKGSVVPLTSTEYRLLEELARHAGTVLPHQYLLERVWGQEYANDVRYLKVFVQRLRRKLGEDAERPRYIHTEWGIGYRMVSRARVASSE